MLPYWLLFGIFTLGAIQYRSQEETIQRRTAPFLGVAAFATALMIGLRYGVGSDWGRYRDNLLTYEYIDFWQAIAPGRFASSLAKDPGYGLVNWLASNLGFEIWFVNLLCGLIFCWGLVQFARHQPNPWLAMLVAVPYLIIVVAMGYTRQAVAIGLTLAALAALAGRPNWIKFTLYIILGASFHKSAIILLPVVALAVSQNRFAIFGLLGIIALLLYYLFIDASLDRMVRRYEEYQSQGALIRVVMNIPPALIFLAFRRRFMLDPLQEKLWRNLSYGAFGALAMLFLLPGYSAAIDRLALYLIPLQLFIFSRLPGIFLRNGGKRGEIVIAVIVYSALIQFTWLSFAENARAWVPYRFYPLEQKRY
ncbi:MAG: EpsG family protein [Sphingomonadaceae bacterium]